MLHPGQAVPLVLVGLAPGTPAQRILVVDDRAEARLLLIRLLSSLGFQVREAANGLEAVEACRAWLPHLIVMDMRMPRLSGLSFLNNLRPPEKADCRVVMLSSLDDAKTRREVLAAGAVAYLVKPASAIDILAAARGNPAGSH